MNHTSKLLGVASIFALAAFGTNSANAQSNLTPPNGHSMTAAGSTITNKVTVNYQVNGVDQTAKSDSNSIIVDRKVSLLVSEVGAETTTVTPGQKEAVTTFKLTNNSNATLDFDLTAAQLSGGTAAHGGTDSFNVTNLKIYVDNGDGSYRTGDTLLTTPYIDELAGDGASRTIFVVANVPVEMTNGQIAGVTLTATAREGGQAGSEGAVLTETQGANTEQMDTVFADDHGPVPGDSDRDGKSSDDDDYTVKAAMLAVAKTSLIIWDPINQATNPKAIPGARIQYCIRVSNEAGGADAENVAIADDLPSEITFETGTIKLMGTVASEKCQLDGQAGDGSYDGSKVTGTLPRVAAGESRTLLFTALIK